jgi:hypothetical protein
MLQTFKAVTVAESKVCTVVYRTKTGDRSTGTQTQLDKYIDRQIDK